MKIIYKILDYYPENNHISVKFCNLKSREPIDSYRSRGVNCDNLDMFDVESFSESLVNQNGLRRVERQENELDTLSENIPDDINEVNLESLKNKVIEYDYKDKTYTLLNMNRVNL